MLFIVQIRTNGDERIVCREAFINIHRITVGRVRHMLTLPRILPVKSKIAAVQEGYL